MRRSWLALIACACSLFGTSLAQVVDSSSASTVNVPVIVVDKKTGVPVESLVVSDLEVTDSKRKVHSILKFSGLSNTVLRLGVLVDTSGSQKATPIYASVLNSLYSFMNRVLRGPEDRLFVQGFDSKPQSQSEWMDAEKVRTFRMEINPHGRTSALDAVVVSCDTKMRSVADRSLRVLVVVTDGEDNASKHNPEDAVKAAIRSGTLVFVVDTTPASRLPTGGEYYTGDDVIRPLAEQSGGVAFSGLERDEVATTFERLERLINSVQMLTYSQDNPAPGFHRLKITSKRKELKVHAPAGYYLH